MNIPGSQVGLALIIKQMKKQYAAHCKTLEHGIFKIHENVLQCLMYGVVGNLFPAFCDVFDNFPKQSATVGKSQDLKRSSVFIILGNIMFN